MKFINRHEELLRLNKLMKLEDASLAVIWGRRRLGKTRLLLEWVDKHKGVYYTADESAASLQRKYFSKALDQRFPGFSSVDYPDWQALLERLAKEAIYNTWRGPLVIDELPYLVSASPEFPSVFQKFIDHDAKRAKLIIAVCGSSQRMMQGAIFNASAPLYGRATEIIKLGPIALGYIGEALEIEKPVDMVESYCIWGGIPRYWELVNNNGKSLLDDIDDLVLNPMGALNDEPNRLLLEEAALSLRPMLDAIGLGARRLSEIAMRIAQPVTSITRVVQRLIELDLIEKEIPFGADEHNTKKTLYKIKDPFLRFWFNLVAAERSYFSQATSKQRKLKLREKLPSLFSQGWEELCRVSVPYISWKNHTFGKASRYWHGQGFEWDILADIEENEGLLIGEAKWLLKKPNAAWIYREFEELKRKGIPSELRDKKNLLYALYIPEKPEHLELPSNLKVIDAQEITTLLQ